MASASFFVGIIGNVISILVFASPMKTFAKIVKAKSTEDYKGLPYVTTLLSTSLWTFYGLLKPNGLLVVTVNGAGAVLQSVYVTLFLINAPKYKKVSTGKLVVVCDVIFLGAVIAITLVAIHGSVRLTVVGIFCAAFTIGMYAAPLAAMRIVIETKSVEYMPFLLSFFLFLNGGVWSIYAVLVKDYYIGVPNAIGFVMGSLQLILYAMYNNNTSSSSKEMEEGKQYSKGDIEMRSPEETVVGNAHCDGLAVADKNVLNLKKGNSLPKPSISRQESLQKIIKTLSLGPYDSDLGQAQGYLNVKRRNKKKMAFDYCMMMLE